jgi:thioesterase domain-containing protein
VLRRLRRTYGETRRKLRGWLGRSDDRRVERVMAAHAEAMSQYFAGTYAGRATLFWSSEYYGIKGEYGNARWAELTAGGVQCHVIEGEHDAMMRAPLVQTFAAQLQAQIDQALHDSY